MSDADGLNDIAIVGMDARLPGAPDLARFWENLRDGVETTTFHSDQPPVVQNGMAFVPACPWLEGIELFDPAFFGFTPREAETMDPQVRLFLECVWTALETAGYDPQRYRGRIGVFAGAATSTYLTRHLLPNEDVMRSAAGMSSLGVLNDRDSLATIASYKLDLQGPSVTVQTFCSTSLVAVHLACQSLLSGESDIVVAGASSINVGARDGYWYSEGGILSPDGHCRTFDERAAGTVFGNGVGVVVLKRLEDALAEGDLIHAVIRGSAINNDGARKAGYTAPSVAGQSKAIAEALAVAQLGSDAISYVEAHGTATNVGDPIEIEALSRAFRSDRPRPERCGIGSVKTNFGHLDRASGIAALIKVVLMLQHRQLPPSLHFERPNPKIDFEASPFRVVTELQEWRSEGPLCAGVSALGVGGTNAHVVVQEPPRRPASGPSRASQLVVVSARTDAALDAALSRLAQHLREQAHVPLADTAWTLLLGRQRFERRSAVVAADAESAAAALESGRVVRGGSRASDRKVAFLFPGQGAQQAGMGRDLYASEAVYREQIDRQCELLKGPLGVDLRELLLAGGAEQEAASERLRQTALTQPALFAMEVALARLWMSWGVTPDAMLGHSIGEYAAAHLAGVMALEEALGLVAERGRLMQGLPSGAMLAVHAAAEQIEPLLSPELALAAVNSPGLCVASGPEAAVDALAARLAERDLATVRLRTSHAFHSPMMDPILEEFRTRVRGVTLKPPAIPFVSNLTGDWITAEQATSADYWVDHLRRPVRFAAGVRTLWSEAERVLLEVGPGEALSGLARAQAAPGGQQTAIPSLARPRGEDPGEPARLLSALGQLWVAGAALEVERLFAGERRQRVWLPTYPFERERYWIDPPDPARSRVKTRGKQPDVADWFRVPTWKIALPPQRFARDVAGGPSRWLLMLGAGSVSDAIVGRLREAGDETIVVRPGPAFGGSRKSGYYLDPGSAADYRRLLEAIGDEGRSVSRIVHAWSVAPERKGELSPEALRQGQEQGFYSLLYLAQALAASGWTQPLELVAVSSQMHRVLAGERGHPERSTLLGLLKVIPQEYQNLSCASLDLESDLSGKPDPAWLETLVRELRAPAPGGVVALRGGQRFVRCFEPLPLPAPPARPTRVSGRGTCLVTGGLGGVTTVLAAYLAHTAGARLVLAGRTRMPERSGWADWRRTHGDADPVSQRMLRVESLERLGAEVLLVSADVASEAELREAVRQGEERFGPLRGVIHGAGVVGGETFRPIDQIGPAECEQQFRPKLQGLLALGRVLRGRSLELCVLTSSLSSVLGGYAYAAYAAANVFMDAWAASGDAAGSGPWLSVNWDEWRLSETPPDPGSRGLAQYALGALEGAGAFGRLLELEGASQVVVSTGDLEARLDQWVRLDPQRAAKLLQKDADAPRRHPRPSLQNAYVAPADAVEEAIARIWAELLGIEKVGTQDNFFDLGGHSLLAIQAITAIRTELRAEVSIASLFEGPTVESLASLIRGAGEAKSFDDSSDRGRRRKEERQRRLAERVGGGA